MRSPPGLCTSSAISSNRAKVRSNRSSKGCAWTARDATSGSRQAGRARAADHVRGGRSGCGRVGHRPAAFRLGARRQRRRHEHRRRLSTPARQRRAGICLEVRSTPRPAIGAGAGIGRRSRAGPSLHARRGRPGARRVVGELAALGLAGLECFYSRYSPDDREGLAELARRHDLVATGGSDFHGTFKPDLSVGTGTGDLDVPDSALTELVGRRPGASL